MLSSFPLVYVDFLSYIDDVAAIIDHAKDYVRLGVPSSALENIERGREA